MAIEDFSKKPHSLNVQTSTDRVRPRVSDNTHQIISRLSVEMGLDISKTYDLLIQNCVKDKDVLDSIIEKSSNNTMETYTEHHMDLLDDLANKVKELGYMPSRSEINSDSDLNGYYLYILHFGSVGNLHTALKEHDKQVSAIVDF